MEIQIFEYFENISDKKSKEQEKKTKKAQPCY